jgi:hypothetical protein
VVEGAGLVTRSKPYVSKGALADKKRRRVRAVGTSRIGQQTRIPKKRPPKRRRPQYRHAGTLAGLSVLFSTFAFMTGSLFWAVGACTTATAGSYVARQAYKRELAEVKRTGRPVGAPARQPAKPADDPLRQPLPTYRAAKPGDDHLSRCKANPPGGPTCRCPDGPNRKGKTAAKRTSTARRKR